MHTCPCGHARSAWDLGGIRWGAASNPHRLLKCPSCGEWTWHVVTRSRGTPSVSPDVAARTDVRDSANRCPRWEGRKCRARRGRPVTEAQEVRICWMGVMWVGGRGETVEWSGSGIDFDFDGGRGEHVVAFSRVSLGVNLHEIGAA